MYSSAQKPPARFGRRSSRGYWKYLFVAALLAFGSSTALKANTLICYTAEGGNPLSLSTSTPSCMSQLNFRGIANDRVDWSSLGATGTNGPSGTDWSTTSMGIQGAPGLTVTLFGPAWTSSATEIQRADEGNGFMGHFKTDATSANLMGYAGAGAFGIEFSHAVTAVGFYISTRSGTAVDATIMAYNTAGTPTSSDIPVTTFRLTDTGGGGVCNTMPLSPCSDAPFIHLDAVNHVFDYITISTTDPTGFYISTMYLDATEGPEPVTGLLIGGGLVVLGTISRKYRHRP